jgi:hypothetical protein
MAEHLTFKGIVFPDRVCLPFESLYKIDIFHKIPPVDKRRSCAKPARWFNFFPVAECGFPCAVQAFKSAEFTGKPLSEMRESGRAETETRSFGIVKKAETDFLPGVPGDDIFETREMLYKSGDIRCCGRTRTCIVPARARLAVAGKSVLIRVIVPKVINILNV